MSFIPTSGPYIAPYLNNPPNIPGFPQLPPLPVSGVVGMRPAPLFGGPAFGAMINPFKKQTFYTPSQQLNFVDPLNGQSITTVAPFGSVLNTTTTVNECGVHVNVSGQPDQVNSVVTMIKDKCKPIAHIADTHKQNSIPLNAPWKYENNPYVSNGSLLVAPNNVVKFSGTGLLLLECKFETSYPFGPTVCKPTVILVARKLPNDMELYEDFGGKFDRVTKIPPNQSTLKINAVKEVAEESQSLFMITSSFDLERNVSGKQLFMDIMDRDGYYYRSYIMFVSGTETKDLTASYTSNKIKIAQGLNNPSVNQADIQAFSETVNLRRFYLSDLIDTGKVGPAIPGTSILQCKDVNGHLCNVRNRILNCVLHLKANRDLLVTAYNNKVVPRLITTSNSLIQFTF